MSLPERDHSVDWRLTLFDKSVIKKEKYDHIVRLLGDTRDLHCLDIGSESGAISYLLRRRGGYWKSVDHEEEVVEAIRGLVKTDVYLIEGYHTPFHDNEFDRIVIVDILEHMENDHAFMRELFRILKPNGELIINTPHCRNSFLQRLRERAGLTEEKLGTARVGYTIDTVEPLLRGRFTIVSYTTYKKFFSHLIDTIIVLIVDRLKQGRSPQKHAPMVTEEDLSANRGLYHLYQFLYPWVWAVCKLDMILFGFDGYMQIVKAQVKKEPIPGCQLFP